MHKINAQFSVYEDLELHFKFHLLMKTRKALSPTVVDFESEWETTLNTLNFRGALMPKMMAIHMVVVR